MAPINHIAKLALLIAAMSVPSQASPPKDQDWFEQYGLDLRPVIADYAKKEPHSGELDVFVYRDTRGLIAVPEEDLESVGIKQGWAGCLGMKTTLVLSLESQANSDQLELCVVEKRWGRESVWYYPVVNRDGHCQISSNGSGELVTFEISADGSILFSGKDIGLAGVRAISQGFEGDDHTIRCLVIYDPKSDSDLTQLVVDEVLTGRSNATVTARVLSNAIRESRKIE